ncbi:MAG: hypothetical protein HY235_04165 [Acidobacteria bacterium]|nr:hypothetical protein [Acidobacteriota bacterium]
MPLWRRLAGIAVLVALLLFCALLVNPYVQNWKLQRYLEETAFAPQTQPQPAEVLTASVVDYAARLGLPVKADQVRVSKSEAGVFIEARYFVRVDLLLYTVDLHFRPSAGAR